MPETKIYQERESSLVNLPDELYTYFFSEELEYGLNSLVSKYSLSEDQEDELFGIAVDLILGVTEYKSLGAQVRNRVGLAGDPADNLTSDLYKLVIKKFPEHFGVKEEIGAVEPEKIRIETFETTPLPETPPPQPQVSTPPPQTKFGNIRIEAPSLPAQAGQHEFTVGQPLPQVFSTRSFLRRVVPVQQIPQEPKQAQVKSGSLSWQEPEKPKEPETAGGVEIKTMPEPPKPPSGQPIDLSKV